MIREPKSILIPITPLTMTADEEWEYNWLYPWQCFWRGTTEFWRALLAELPEFSIR